MLTFVKSEVISQLHASKQSYNFEITYSQTRSYFEKTNLSTFHTNSSLFSSAKKVTVIKLNA